MKENDAQKIALIITLMLLVTNHPILTITLNQIPISTTTTIDHYIESSHSREHIAYLSATSLNFYSPSTTTSYSKNLDDKPQITDHTSLGCWSHSELCVVCGQGGCVGTSFSGNVLSLHSIYAHKKYSQRKNGAEVIDFVRKVLTLDKTKFFITIESLIIGEGGIFRWKWGEDSCYQRYIPKENTYGLHVYDMELAPFSQNLLVSNFETQNLLVINVANMVTQSEFNFSGNFKPTKLTAFGYDPTICRTLVCSSTTGQCKFLNYCQSSQLEEFQFYTLTDLSTSDLALTSYIESEFFVLSYKTTLEVRKYSDIQTVLYTDTSSTVSKMSISTVRQFSNILVTELEKVYQINFTQDNFSQCHDFCRSEGCTRAFERGYCTSCGSESLQSEFGCTDGTPQDSPNLVGGMKINPAYITFDESGIECYSPPTVNKKGIPLKKKEVATTFVENKHEWLIALSITAFMLLMLLIMITYSKFQRGKKNKQFAKTTNPRAKNDKTTSQTGNVAKKARYVDHDDSSMNPVMFESPTQRQIDPPVKPGYGTLQSTDAKRSLPTSMSKDNPFIPQGRHIRGKKVKSGLKKDRYKLDSKFGDTQVDLGGLKIVNKKLDFQRSITKPNLDDMLEDEEEKRMSEDEEDGNAQNINSENYEFEF